MTSSRNGPARGGPGWQVTLAVEAADADAVADALVEMGAAVGEAAVPDADRRQLCAHFADRPDRARLAAATGAAALIVEPLPETDWLAEARRGLAPVTVGGFHVHDTHHGRAAPAGLIAIRVTPGRAFGTGHHATTQGCLAAIGRLRAVHRVRTALDMGTGSGILAIAVAKAWGRQVRVIACDNDACAVEVAAANLRRNRMTRRVRAVGGDGYAAAEVAAGGPYDLITANILARPLIDMAPALAHYLAPAGRAVLSGLLVDQAAEVVAAHRAYRLDLLDRIDIEGWSTLVLG